MEKLGEESRVQDVLLVENSQIGNTLHESGNAFHGGGNAFGNAFYSKRVHFSSVQSKPIQVVCDVKQ